MLTYDKTKNPDPLNLRIHRALSWLEQAQQSNDIDAKFIFLWIAFNAAYAQDLSANQHSPDKGMFMQYLHKICNLDADHTIYKLVWDTYSGSIRVLLNNQYTFQPFWDFQNGLISEADWKQRFEVNKKQAVFALGKQDTPKILTAVFDHIYTLRNQIVHGGATHNSRVNRAQVQDACNILSSVIPALLQIMLNHPHDAAWGKPYYPVINI